MLNEQQDFTLYTLRRKELVNRVKAQHPTKKGVILLIAGFEHEKYRFLQESSFFYCTGLQEPALVASLDLDDNTSTLYLPHCGVDRSIWLTPAPVSLSQENSGTLGFTHVTYLGQKINGYQMSPFFSSADYEHLITRLTSVIAQGGSLFTCRPEIASNFYQEQRFILERLSTIIPGLTDHLIDISPLVANMRRVKTAEEVEYITRAIEVTAVAQEAAGKAIADGVNESEVQASLEYMITGSGATMAFPSIVASGANTTILHYHTNDRTMQHGDLVVVVDIGAQVQGYCADITRTYPVSGKFTQRQKELYKLVLEVQAYIANIAKPGMWLSNKDVPEKSLNHLAKKYLADHGGYDTFMPHGIGHFLGLDVHDVGDSTIPLQEGDVVTIEPGIYIRQEGIGIRIEDNYWIVGNGAVCLSDEIPKQMHEIEALVQERFER
jgi:Xaa-Pro aminopeptidase